MGISAQPCIKGLGRHLREQLDTHWSLKKGSSLA